MAIIGKRNWLSDMTLDMRQASLADSEWLYDTYKQTMREYVTRAMGWDECAQRNAFTKSLRQGSCRIAMQEDERCGFVHLEIEPDLVWLRMLCVVPALQRRSFGREMLEHVMLLARSLNKPLYLHVFHCNRIAYEWYLRMGFIERNSSDTVASLTLGGQ